MLRKLKTFFFLPLWYKRFQNRNDSFYSVREKKPEEMVREDDTVEM